MIYYSSALNAFFDSDIPGVNLPSEAIAISDELYFSVMSHRPLGKSIVPGEDGLPMLVDTPPDSQPLVCNRYQLRRALRIKGWRSAVESFVASADDDIQDAYDHLDRFTESHPLMILVAGQINKTTADLRQLMQLAVTLQPGS